MYLTRNQAGVYSASGVRIPPSPPDPPEPPQGGFCVLAASPDPPETPATGSRPAPCAPRPGSGSARADAANCRPASASARESALPVAVRAGTTPACRTRAVNSGDGPTGDRSHEPTRSSLAQTGRTGRHRAAARGTGAGGGVRPAQLAAGLRPAAGSTDRPRFRLLTRRQVLRRVRQVDVAGAEVDDVLVLAPEKRPVLLVLREIGLEHQHARHDAACDEAEVGPVHGVGHLLGL